MIRNYLFILLTLLQAGAAPPRPRAEKSCARGCTLAASPEEKPNTQENNYAVDFSKAREDFASLIGLLLDLLLLLLLFLGAYYGYTNGILSHLVFSFACASPFFIGRLLLDGSMVHFIQEHFSSLSELAPVIAFVVVLSLYFLLFVFVRHLFEFVFRQTPLVHLDNILGAVFYLFFTAVLLSSTLFLLEQKGMRIPPQYTETMHLYKTIRDVFPQLVYFINSKLPALDAFLRGK